MRFLAFLLLSQTAYAITPDCSGTPDPGLCSKHNAQWTSASGSGCVVYSTGSVSCSGDIKGDNTTANLVSVSSISYSSPASTGTALGQVETVKAWSIDGLSTGLSTGCVVVVDVGNTTSSKSNYLTLTSTTTAGAQPFIGVVLSPNCLPSSECTVAVRGGPLRVQLVSGQTRGAKISTTATRCSGQSQSAYSVQYSGMWMAVDNSGWGTAFLNGP